MHFAYRNQITRTMGRTLPSKSYVFVLGKIPILLQRNKMGARICICKQPWQATCWAATVPHSWSFLGRSCKSGLTEVFQDESTRNVPAGRGRTAGAEQPRVGAGLGGDVGLHGDPPLSSRELCTALGAVSKKEREPKGSFCSAAPQQGCEGAHPTCLTPLPVRRQLPHTVPPLGTPSPPHPHPRLINLCR